MGELEFNNPPFEVEANISGHTQVVSVQPEETSDGEPYYRCSMAGKQQTQIRSDERGKWEQLWGDLPQAQVDAIGEAIKAKI